ncbi:TfoX/Sxy family protein [Pseudokineococcus basanitobsidens]|uniref:TfoX/Sxy family protein n=1 Tax=Pseudokineococcus basanitobsidens TaxID=1926649 RepID=A0ABU8RMA6_9ACTN
MAYDEQLADRVRAVLDDEPDVDERRMFGGLALLLGGRMAVAVTGRGGLMVRVGPAGVGPDAAEELLDRPGVEPVVMPGRPTRGWVHVRAERLGDDAALEEWVRRGADEARRGAGGSGDGGDGEDGRP